MLSKEQAFAATKAAQMKVIEDAISEAVNSGKFECEILNLSDEEKGILEQAGYKVERSATRQGFVNKIIWE